MFHRQADSTLNNDNSKMHVSNYLSKMLYAMLSISVKVKVKELYIEGYDIFRFQIVYL